MTDTNQAPAPAPADPGKDAPAEVTIAANRPSTSLELEVAHLKDRLHGMETAVHNYLTHGDGVGHHTVKDWLEGVKNRILSHSPVTKTAPSAQPAPAPDVPPSDEADHHPV